MRPFIVAAALLLAPSAHAHEFIVKPGVVRAEAGTPVPFSVVSSHVFMAGEELEDAEDVSVAVLHDNKRQSLPLVRKDAMLTYDGQVAAPTSGTFMLVGTRLAQTWSLTPDGLKRGTPATLPGATSPMKIEKFSKTLINLSPSDQGYAAIAGDRLEIVPTSNPATLKPGQDLNVRILFDGKPLSTRVYASYDGFTDNKNTYAYLTETADDGTARVRATVPGLWMVRVEQRMNERAAGHERYMARAVLVFEVKE
ncbi:MAG: DUF4198 domain-containing protein [Gemmatimonadaceae bacterium]|nr:DUF4198 domain-containing protein [Acetobacteraceae bacterium]